MSSEDDEVRQLCRCGKYGYPNRQSAERVARILAKRKPARRRRHSRSYVHQLVKSGDLNAYVCTMSDSGMWHVGHQRKGKL